MSKHTITMSDPRLGQEVVEADKAELDPEFGHLMLRDAQGKDVAIFARGAFACVVKSP
ncbi:hypothetical protein LGT39_05810 [Demequina sp. TTPB684]|uniref:hypothetical protein n=1 Tax=unclassified Demequina TaxID=2620311 RepID=UPI001CF3613A|nr:MULTISPECIES: hypothetical protein [unclassified Demequina]MCB2412363.1 hypothetical protein [Demequina sp. TTPB684]UPU89033.1 hypothetical protein LGT36_003665 [Demequina sp. TMPB413]